jgi:spermidine synthase
MTAPEAPAPVGAASHPPVLHLLVTVFVTGAAVMALEIVGTRLIAPVFGINLFVWTALLSVTLASLAIGYYVGGRLIDRRPTIQVLGWCVVVAAVSLAIARAFVYAVLALTAGLGPRSGPLLAATLLFAPCLSALGAAGPVAARLALRDLHATGRTTGTVYAVSTLGSLASTIVMGFWIIPNFDTYQIIIAVAIGLGLLGAALLRKGGRATAIAISLMSVFAATSVGEPTLPPELRLLDRAQSFYGRVEVIEDEARGVRLLRADHSIIGAAHTRDGSAAFSFLHILEALRFARPTARSVLQIGLGTGALASSLQREGLRVDVVELDPTVVRFAREYFGFAPHGQVGVDDARTFIRHTTRHYDAIVHDTFTGGTTPEHLLSVEVVRRLRELLNPGGILVLNFAGYHAGTHAEASFAVARTLRAVFGTVRAFWDEPIASSRDEVGNIAFFAADGAIAFDIPENAHFENAACARIVRSFQDWEVLRNQPAGPIITDAHNTLTRLQLPIAEAHFAAMTELLPRALWLN